MGYDWNQMFEQFSTPEGTFLLLILLVGFLVGYLVGLFLRQARVRQLSQNIDSQKAFNQQEELVIADLHGHEVELRQNLASREKEVKVLRRELNEAQTNARKLEAEKDQLFHEVYAINAEVEKLNAAEESYAATIDELNSQILSLKARLAEAENENTAVALPRETPSQPGDSVNSPEHATLKKRLKTVLEQVKALQEENEMMRQAREAPPADDAVTQLPGENAQEQPRRPFFEYNALEPFKPTGARPSGTTNGSSRDDLTLIEGIGPFMQRKLNRMGIRHFEDIGKLDEKGLQDLSHRLQISESRIEQDNWTGQANRLHELKTDDPDTFDRLSSHPSDRGNLQVVEGIGPAVEKLLKESGIKTWDELADAGVDKLKELLHDSGPSFQIHDPSTWPIQATLAVNGHWKLLEEYQERLNAGRDMPYSRS